MLPHMQMGQEQNQVVDVVPDRAEGIQVLRIWEHELNNGAGLNRAIMRITAAISSLCRCHHD